MEMARLPVPALSARWLEGGSLAVNTLDGRLLLVVPPYIDASPGTDPASATITPDGRRVQPVVVELQSTWLPSALAGCVHAPVFPPARRGAGSVRGCAPLGLARGHLVSMHWLGGQRPAPATTGTRGATAPGVAFSAQPLLHPSLRACMAVQAAARFSGNPVAAYIEAAAAAAGWGAALPPAAQTGLAGYLAGLGNVPAALMLPGLAPAAAIPIALSRRTDAFKAAGRAAADGSASYGGAPAAVDAHVAAAYLRRLLRTVSDEDIAALAGARGGGLGDGVDCLAAGQPDLHANHAPVWPQVAAFLAMAAAVGAVSDAAGVQRDIATFAARCAVLDLPVDAALVAAAMHAAGAPAPSEAQAGAGAHMPPTARLIEAALAAAGHGAWVDAAAAAGLTRLPGSGTPAAAPHTLAVVDGGADGAGALAHMWARGMQAAALAL
jgi:hypothetical protein